MKKLIDFWTSDDDDNLKRKIQNNTSVYDFPSYNEVIDYLKETDADGDIENVMDDLVIQFIEEEFWLENC